MNDDRKRLDKKRLLIEKGNNVQIPFITDSQLFSINLKTLLNYFIAFV